jgi:O-methyltransferase involved in polyketide biosynthesis
MTAKDTVRHDGDSWDLASSVGATATAVAARRAMASKGPDPLIDDPFAEPLVNAVGVEAFIKMMNGEIELADEDPAFTPRRLAEGMAVRTRFFDAFFTEAAAAGVRQAVILAAGLDTRAYRLPWPAGTTVYEVDQPQVIEFKSRTLADLGAAPTADRIAVAVDLRDDWVGGVDRRRTAGLPAAGRAGPVVRHHHHAQFQRQPDRNRIRSGHARPNREARQADQRALASARTEPELVRAGLRR